MGSRNKSQKKSGGEWISGEKLEIVPEGVQNEIPKGISGGINKVTSGGFPDGMPENITVGSWENFLK